MKEEERGRSPCENQAAVAGPLDVTRVRERRRFFSSGALPTRAATAVTAPAAVFADDFTAGFPLPSAAFSTFAVGFGTALAATFAAGFGAAFFGAVFFGAGFYFDRDNSLFLLYDIIYFS